MSAIGSVTSMVRGGLVPKAARAYIIPLDPYQADKVVLDELRVFQYFPETIQDTKAVNWQSKEIPGLSHPLYLSIEHHSDEVYVVSGDPCGIEYLQKKGIILEAKEGDKALARKFGCPLGDVFKVNFIKELPLDLSWNQIPEADKIIQVLLQTS